MENQESTTASSSSTENNNKADFSADGDEVSQAVSEFFEEKGVDTREGRERWYGHTLEYWKAQESSESGVLEGFVHVTGVDIGCSLEFVNKAVSVFDGYADKFNNNEESVVPHFEFGVAADVGAGVGRVTKHLLSKLFKQIDVYEPVSKHLNAAKQNLEPLCGSDKVHFQYINQSLQDFDPSPDTYDVIWAQWCVLYLTDKDFSVFLEKCSVGLKDSGILVIKENSIPDIGLFADANHADYCSHYCYSDTDNSFIRKDSHYRKLFADSPLSLFLVSKQRKWPKNLIPVLMYALKKPFTTRRSS